MNTNRTWYGLVAASLVLAGLIAAPGAAEEQTHSPPAEATTAAGTKGVVVLPAIRLHLKKRRITIDAEVHLRQAALEVLLCRTERHKEHETILISQANPSDLHAVLLALGLAPGKPAEWIVLDEEGNGRAVPPRGAALTVKLRWKDADGKQQEADASDWLAVAQGRRGEIPKQWIFVGSQLLPDGSYWGDLSGELIAVSNFPSAVIDVPFPSSNKNAELVYAANTEAIPPVGTKVQVVITPVAEADKAEHARATLFIDRNGSLMADEQPIALADVTDWAEQFMERHAKGRVVIRATARALQEHVQQAHVELRIGGVWDIVETRAALPGRLLPRTAEQAKAQLKQLRDELANANQLLADPRHEARLLLKEIEQETKELERLKELWADYAAGIREALGEEDAAPRPAEDDAD